MALSASLRNSITGNSPVVSCLHPVELILSESDSSFASSKVTFYIYDADNPPNAIEKNLYLFQGGLTVDVSGELRLLHNRVIPTARPASRHKKHYLHHAENGGTALLNVRIEAKLTNQNQAFTNLISLHSLQAPLDRDTLRTVMLDWLYPVGAIMRFAHYHQDGVAKCYYNPKFPGSVTFALGDSINNNPTELLLRKHYNDVQENPPSVDRIFVDPSNKWGMNEFYLPDDLDNPNIKYLEITPVRAGQNFGSGFSIHCYPLPQKAVQGVFDCDDYGIIKFLNQYGGWNYATAKIIEQDIRIRNQQYQQAASPNNLLASRDERYEYSQADATESLTLSFEKLPIKSHEYFLPLSYSPSIFQINEDESVIRELRPAQGARIPFNQKEFSLSITMTYLNTYAF